MLIDEHRLPPLAQYGGRVIVPLDQVCRDFFPHLSLDKFLSKVNAGEIAIPVTRMRSAKRARGVHLQELAAYIDKRCGAAV